MRVLHPEATVHGRVLIEEASRPAGLLIGFHGYGQVAEDIHEQLTQIPGTGEWTKVSIQALNRFYTRGDGKVVANWMTRQDRELAIADNIAYVQNALDDATGTSDSAPRTSHPALRTVFVGFSQGASMAYRAALHSRHGAAGIVALAGDIPPEVKDDQSRVWPKVLIGVGDGEEWYAGPKLDVDLEFLRARGVTHDVIRFPGGHEWTDQFRAAVGDWLTTL